MIDVIRADERGATRLNWLDSKHTFSFGGYHNPGRMGFGPLRVINEDRVTPAQGFGTHGHRDMEILSYVIDGALEHRDSLGNGSVIRPGDVQRMSAGTGVMHSEYNESDTEPVHFLQIWILPEQAGLAPGYEQKHFAEAERHGAWRLLASRDGRAGSLTIHQDVDLYGTVVNGTESLSHRFADGRRGWLQVVRGTVVAAGERLEAGDGLAVTDLAELEVRAEGAAELLLFDIAR